jgi:hypothetical protein
MNVSIKLDALLEAVEWVSAGESVGLDCGAYVARATGDVHCWGEGTEEDGPPEHEGDAHVAVPGKKELDLGRSLALRFVEEHMPRSEHVVRDFFRKRGAYANFKSLLTDAGQLDAWHAFEEVATELALGEWCEANGFVVEDKGSA